MNPSIELRHLRYFLAVAETQNFTRAAERLGVSQPSVSQQIKDLETALGATLLRRLGKRLQLTEEGASFRANAAVVVRKLEEACGAVGAQAQGQAGHVEVGVVPAAHMAWIPMALTRMAREHPGVTVAVHEQSARAIETEVEAGRWDLGCGVLLHSSPNLRYEALLAQKLSLIVPGGHPLAARESVSVKELREVPLVLLPGTFDMRHAIDELFARGRTRPNVLFEISTVCATLATVTRAGIPTVLTPIVFAGREWLDLQAVPIRESGASVEYGLVTAKSGELSPGARAFAEIVREVGRAGGPGRGRRG